MVAVLVLIVIFLLPNLHHLPGHDAAAGDESCALCLLLDLTFLALPVLPGTLLACLFWPA